MGDPAEIVREGVFTLTGFAADEFHTGSGTYDPTEWIFRENGAQPGGSFEQWHVVWDASGIEQGTYLIRAVATDVLGATDDMVGYQNVSLTFDGIAPAAVIATVTTPDDVTHDAVNDLYFDATTKWFKVCATTDATGHLHDQARVPDSGPPGLRRLARSGRQRRQRLLRRHRRDPGPERRGRDLPRHGHGARSSGTPATCRSIWAPTACSTRPR